MGAFLAPPDDLGIASKKGGTAIQFFRMRNLIIIHVNGVCARSLVEMRSPPREALLFLFYY